MLPNMVKSQIPSDNEFWIKSASGTSKYLCSFVNGRLTATSLWDGSGTKAEPYTNDCQFAAPKKDSMDKRKSETHYAYVKLGGAAVKTVMCKWNGAVYSTAGINTASGSALTGTCQDMVDAGAQGVLADGLYWFRSTDTQYTGASNFNTWCNLNSVTKKGFALIAKFSKNNFCYYSGNWNRNEYNQGQSKNKNMPSHRQYDTLNEAYGRMAVSNLYFTGHRNYDLKKASHIGFASKAAPRKLMTSQGIKITTYPNWNKWQLHFGGGRQSGPQFMRDAKWELASKPYKDGASQRCRSQGQGSTRNPSGCGKKCVFCFQSGDGNCCNAGCGHRHNDVSFGLGLSSSYCGGGDGSDCSASGNWADNANKVIVWGI